MSIKYTEMAKKIKMFFSCLFAAAVVAFGVAVFNFNLDAQSDNLSDIALANIEALAQNEGRSSYSWDCWSSLKEGFGVWVCGSPCEFKDDRGPGSGKSKCYSD